MVRECANSDNFFQAQKSLSVQGNFSFCFICVKKTAWHLLTHNSKRNSFNDITFSVVSLRSLTLLSHGDHQHHGTVQTAGEKEGTRDGDRDQADGRELEPAFDELVDWRKPLDNHQSERTRVNLETIFFTTENLSKENLQSSRWTCVFSFSFEKLLYFACY